ncbi:MAG: hypothetical protein ACOVMM_02970 [Chitinophagaceae bacterium]
MSNASNTYNYVVELKHKSTKHITIIGVLLLVFAYAMSLYFIYERYSLLGENIELYNKLLPIILATIISMVVFIFKLYKYYKGDNLYLFWALAFASFIWLYIPKMQWIMALYVVLAFLDRPLKVTPEYGFDSFGITLNSFPEKKYSWSEVSNVVIKFNMLTIDFVNNKIIQAEISEDISLQLEKEFNDYCKSKINEHHT